MKTPYLILISTILAAHTLAANPETDQTNSKPTQDEIATTEKQHAASAKKLSIEQDDLSADVQDLIDEQTDPKVIQLLSEIEITMAEATDLLEQTNTGGATIAVETEIIEKIFDAAKKKKKQSGGG